MIKIVTIIRSNEEKDEAKVHFDKIGDYWEVKTEPYNMVVEDSVNDMLEDIGEWDINYLKECVGSNISMVATGL